MPEIDAAALAAFLENHASDLAGIVRYSLGQWRPGDLHGEAYLALVDLGEKHGRALDLHDPEDAALLLRNLRNQARRAGGVLRKAWRPDQDGPEDGERSRRPLWDRLAADEGEHPLSLLEALESAEPEPEPVDPYHSEIAAWQWLLQRFDRRMADIAAFLLISVSWCRQRRCRARHRAQAQWQLPHRLLVGGDDANAIQPWRKFKLPEAPAVDDSRQLAFDGWGPPQQPACGQLRLL